MIIKQYKYRVNGDFPYNQKFYGGAMQSQNCIMKFEMKSILRAVIIIKFCRHSRLMGQFPVIQ